MASAGILTILAGVVTAAANDREDAPGGPSRFEYLVLTSVSDATWPLSLATYRSAPQK